MRVTLALIWTCLATLLAGCAVAPNPLDNEQLRISVAENLKAINGEQEPVSGPIDLFEAVARALKYNLEHRAKEAQVGLQMAELDLAHYSLLPSIAAKAGYDGRTPQSAASSLNLVTNTPNFGSSTSQDARIRTSEISFGWNILDFGLSYVRAKQSADKVLISEEMRRRMAVRLVEDVRTAFWRTAALERLFSRLKSIDRAVWAQIANNRAIVASHDSSPITALTAERELIELMRLLRSLQRDLLSSRTKLARLMNIPPGTKFRLKAKRRPAATFRASGSLWEMIDRALEERSEIRENLYRQRINKEEARAALLELLPGVQLFAAKHTDSNSFLLNSDWRAWGTRAGWNLLKVFQYPAKRFLIDQQDEVLKTQALAMTMAVMTQVQLSRARLFVQKKDYSLARAQVSVQSRLVRQLRHEKAEGRISGQEVLRERLQLLVAEARRNISYAELDNAHANLMATLGGDPYEEIDREQSVKEIAGTLRGEAAPTVGKSGPLRIASN